MIKRKTNIITVPEFLRRNSERFQSIFVHYEAANKTAIYIC